MIFDNTRHEHDGSPGEQSWSSSLFAVHEQIFIISKRKSLIMCADDTCLFITGSETEYIVKYVNKVLDSFYECAKGNFLIIDPKKITAVIFRSKIES